VKHGNVATDHDRTQNTCLLYEYVENLSRSACSALLLLLWSVLLDFVDLFPDKRTSQSDKGFVI